MLSFALKTLFSDRSKLLTGLLGVIFSLVLVNVQGGLYFGLMRKASLLVDHCDADLWVTHKQVENVDLAREIPDIWRQRLKGTPGIRDVQPYLVGKGTASLSNGHMEDVWIIGSDPDTMLGSAWGFTEGSRAALKRPNGVSFDEVDATKLGNPRVGDWMEVNGQRTRIVARTRGITGFITMPYLFTTYETARKLSRNTVGTSSFFLVRVKPGVDVERLRKIVKSKVPDAAVYTPAEFAGISQDYWMKRTGIGVSFGAATLLGLLVGLAVVGQSLYAMALNHLEDYATLKALGAEDRDVCRVIVGQALCIGIIGSLSGLGIVAAIRGTWDNPLAPVEIPLFLMGGSVLLMLLICLAAAGIPYFRIRKVDPAMVLMG
ncbi:MAG: ABC transporter permease [Planctomycetales bacterium]